MFSRLVRKVHMYLALFLTPWVLMYTLSTMAMNHRKEGNPPPAFEPAGETTWNGSFPPGASARQKAVQILASLDMDGAHNVQERDGRLVIVRFEPVRPVRLTYTAAGDRLQIERQQFRSGAFLERFHRRRGYQHDYALEDTWAASVDLFIVAMIFWALSGLWMWWELRITRRWGLVALAGGAGLFAFFLAAI